MREGDKENNILGIKSLMFYLHMHLFRCYIGLKKSELENSLHIVMMIKYDIRRFLSFI